MSFQVIELFHPLFTNALHLDIIKRKLGSEQGKHSVFSTDFLNTEL